MTLATRALIHTSALTHNLLRAREMAPQAAVMAVVKADAYGHGLHGVIQALEQADAFAVAHVVEGVAARDETNRPVVVLEGVREFLELTQAAAHDLEIVVHCFEQLEMLEGYAGEEQFTVWLKLDTGMNRLGFPSEQAEEATTRLQACAAVRQPVKFMTHLANADDRRDAMTERQLAEFTRFLQDKQDAVRSIANSGGLLGWPASHADWVRPGIMLYGASPFIDVGAEELGLEPAMTFESHLIAVKQVKRGESVGYGGVWTAEHDTRIGVAAVGYGDGYPRHAPNGTPVLVNGQRSPLAGRVSMDMITVDLNEQPEARIGDSVVLWGRGLPVDEIARHAGTIAYELLCGVTRRVPRNVGPS